jgi:hypothetical protein
MSPNKIILWLFDHGTNEAQLLSDGVYFGDAFSRLFRGTPIKRLAYVNKVVESPYDLLYGCVCIVSMGIKNVNIVKLEPFKRMQYALNNMLPGKCIHFINARTTFAKEEFCANDQILPLPPKLLDCFA